MRRLSWENVVFRLLRIAVLLYLLLFVALSSWVTRAISTDWDRTLWVNVYPIAADDDPATRSFVESLEDDDFDDVVALFQREAARYGSSGGNPLRIAVGPVLDEAPPLPPQSVNIVSRAWWSLSLRYWSYRATRDDDLPTPDVRLFLLLHAPEEDRVLDRSVGLAKGMVAIVHAFAARRHHGANQLVFAHELLHTLGATDKYDLATGQPLHPHGYAEPDRQPLHPQVRTEIMGGRRPLDAHSAEMPRSLDNVIFGPLTAAEIRLAKPD